MAVTLFLVRHGQTAWNLTGRRQGHAGPGLTDIGWEQAHRAAQSLKSDHQPLHAVYSSDLDRAHQTATVIGQTLSLPVHPDHRLRERHQGRWQGQLTADVVPAGERAYADPFGEGPPGGETGFDVLERVSTAFDQMVQQHAGERVVIVTHGGVIMLLRWLAAGRTPPQAVDNDDFWSAHPANGAVTPLHWPLPGSI